MKTINYHTDNQVASLEATKKVETIEKKVDLKLIDNGNETKKDLGAQDNGSKQRRDFKKKHKER